MNDENNNIIIETPSSAFSDLSNDIKKDIEKLAEEWKCQKTKGDKINITEVVKKKYIKIPRAYEYFEALKHVRKDGTLPRKKPKLKNPEALARDEFAVALREFIKKYFKNNTYIDQNSKIFLLDENYNLPPYFWTRMNKNVLPKITTLDGDKKVLELHAWQLAIGIMKKYEIELGDRLQKTVFTDLNHVSNTIIQFFNKYMLSTYKELMQKAREQVINKKKYENQLKEKEQEDIYSNTIKKRGGGIKEVQSVGFDTTGLL